MTSDNQCHLPTEMGKSSFYIQMECGKWRGLKVKGKKEKLHLFPSKLQVTVKFLQKAHDFCLDALNEPSWAQWAQLAMFLFIYLFTLRAVEPTVANYCYVWEVLMLGFSLWSVSQFKGKSDLFLCLAVILLIFSWLLYLLCFFVTRVELCCQSRS